jgi:hypothetical protein
MGFTRNIYFILIKHEDALGYMSSPSLERTDNRLQSFKRRRQEIFPAFGNDKVGWEGQSFVLLLRIHARHCSRFPIVRPSNGVETWVDLQVFLDF